jgi:hypothetical protein
VIPPLKLFFDECCSRRLARKIVEIYAECYPDLETRHLSQLCALGTRDPEWLPMLEKEKGWIVLTADRGRDPKREKLPAICERLGITHISMTPKLVSEGYTIRKQALLTVWPQIIKIPLLPKPTRVSLGFRMVDNGLTRMPWLSIEQDAFATWCRSNNVIFENSGGPK